MKQFICPRCGNSDPRYIGDLKGKPYCRFCISLKGDSVDLSYKPQGSSVVLDLAYSLSKEQQNISDQIIENYKKGIDTLVNAVCGAGKTELVYGVIAYALRNNLTVGFAIPRRDVASELTGRMRSAFPSTKIVLVYGGETSRLEADIVVLTTHQLFRYTGFFDLLILDEVDAFPYKGSPLLEIMFEKAVRGHSVIMSATPSDDLLKKYKKTGKAILELNTRFHRHEIPVPQIVVKNSITKYIYLKRKLGEFLTNKKPVLIFAPTIELCESTYRYLKIFYPKGYYVHSKLKNREEVIRKFKKGIIKYLVTTAVLERGVTIKDLQVIIFDADSKIYDEYSLTQIAGRVGRKFDAPEGEVIYLSNKITEAMEHSISTIKIKNTYLQVLRKSN